MNETKEQRRERQDREYRKMIREISDKDAGECFRNNMFWRIQGRVEIIN
jgi:hypothetical protein